MFELGTSPSKEKTQNKKGNKKTGLTSFVEPQMNAFEKRYNIAGKFNHVLGVTKLLLRAVWGSNSSVYVKTHIPEFSLGEHSAVLVWKDAGVTCIISYAASKYIGGVGQYHIRIIHATPSWNMAYTSNYIEASHLVLSALKSEGVFERYAGSGSDSGSDSEPSGAGDETDPDVQMCYD